MTTQLESGTGSTTIVDDQVVAHKSTAPPSSEPEAESPFAGPKSADKQVAVDPDDAAAKLDTSSFKMYVSNQQRKNIQKNLDSGQIVEDSQQKPSESEVPKTKTGIAAWLPPKVEDKLHKSIELAIDRYIESTKLPEEAANNFKDRSLLFLKTPSVAKFLKNGKLDADTAVKTIHHFLNNLSHPCLDKYVSNGTIKNIDQAIFASERQVRVLSKPGVQKYIDSGQLSIETALTLTEDEADAFDNPGVQKILSSEVDGTKVKVEDLFRPGNDVEYLTEPVNQRFIHAGQMTTSQVLNLRSTKQVEFLAANEKEGLKLGTLKGNVLEHVAIHELRTTGKNTPEFEYILSPNQKAFFSNPTVRSLMDAGKISDSEALTLSSQHLPRLSHQQIQDHIISGRTSVSEITNSSEGEFQILWSKLNAMKKATL